MNLFLKLYQSVALQEKSDYLLALLEKHEPLKREFLQKYKAEFEDLRQRSELVYEGENLIQTIELDAGLLQSILSKLDLEEPDWDQDLSYGSDDDFAQIFFEEEATNVFEPFCTDFEASLLDGDLIDIGTKLSAIVHGILIAEINDPYNNLGDPSNDYFISAINEILNSKSQAFKERIFLAKEFKNSFDLIFSFNQKHYQETHEFLKAISNFLIQVIKNTEIAQMAWISIQQYEPRIKMVPKLLSHITYLLGDKDLWLESLESTFLADYDTSIQLLDYYYQNDKYRFEEKAPQLSGHFEYWSTDYLIDKVKKGTELHVTLLKKKVSTGGDYQYFQELKQWMTELELKQFIASIYPANIKVNLYGKEEMYEELERLIRKELLSSPYYTYFNFVEAIKYLYPVNPDLAWELTVMEINQRMNSNKKRKSYTYLAGLLKESLSIDGKSQEVKSFINQLYNHRPNLPALKDEFRNAGIL